jgi:hypothetical protein
MKPLNVIPDEGLICFRFQSSVLHTKYNSSSPAYGVDVFVNKCNVVSESYVLFQQLALIFSDLTP